MLFRFYFFSLQNNLRVYSLFIWPHCTSCRILSSLTRDQTHNLCIGSAVLTTELPGKSSSRCYMLWEASEAPQGFPFYQNSVWFSWHRKGRWRDMVSETVPWSTQKGHDKVPFPYFCVLYGSSAILGSLAVNSPRLAMWGFLSCQTPRQEAPYPLLAPSPAMYIYLGSGDIKAKQMAKFSPELSAALPEQKFEFTTMFLYSWSIKPPAYTDLALKLWIFLYQHS